MYIVLSSHLVKSETFIISSAVDYAGKKGAVNVSLINLHSLFIINNI